MNSPVPFGGGGGTRPPGRQCRRRRPQMNKGRHLAGPPPTQLEIAAARYQASAASSPAGADHRQMRAIAASHPVPRQPSCAYPGRVIGEETPVPDDGFENSGGDAKRGACSPSGIATARGRMRVMGATAYQGRPDRSGQTRPAISQDEAAETIMADEVKGAASDAGRSDVVERHRRSAVREMVIVEDSGIPPGIDRRAARFGSHYRRI